MRVENLNQYDQKMKLKLQIERYFIYNNILSMQKSPTDADLQAVSDKFMEVIKELENSKNWEEIQNQPVRIEKLQCGDRLVTKSELTFNIPFETVANFFKDPTYVKKITDRVANVEILYQNEALAVIHTHMKGFAMISDRELLAISVFHREGNKIYFGNRSCEYPCKPYEDTVRAFAYCAGTILEKMGDNSTKFISLTDIDMNGSIPKLVMNKFSQMRAGRLMEIEQKIKESLK